MEVELNAAVFVRCGLMLLKLLMDGTKHNALAMVCCAPDKPSSLMRHTPIVWIKQAPGFSILFQWLRTSWFLVQMSPMHLTRPLLLNRAFTSHPTKLSLNGGWIIRNFHLSLMATSSLSYQVCRAILNLCLFERSMPMLFYNNLVSPQPHTNPAYTPESSMAHKLFSFARSMILLLHFTWHAGQRTHYSDQKTGLSWHVQWYWYHSNTNYIKISCRSFIDMCCEKHLASWMSLYLMAAAHSTPLTCDPNWFKKFNAAIGDPDPTILAMSMHLSYRSGIGKLIWAMTTCCPDLAYTSVKLSQSNSCPHEHHYHGLRHALKYLYTTRDNVLYFWRTSPLLELKEGPLPTVHSNKLDLMLDNWLEHDVGKESTRLSPLVPVIQHECRSNRCVRRQFGRPWSIWLQ